MPHSTPHSQALPVFLLLCAGRRCGLPAALRVRWAARASASGTALQAVHGVAALTSTAVIPAPRMPPQHDSDRLGHRTRAPTVRPPRSARRPPAASSRAAAWPESRTRARPNFALFPPAFVSRKQQRWCVTRQPWRTRASPPRCAGAVAADLRALAQGPWWRERSSTGLMAPPSSFWRGAAALDARAAGDCCITSRACCAQEAAGCERGRKQHESGC